MAGRWHLTNEVLVHRFNYVCFNVQVREGRENGGVGRGGGGGGDERRVLQPVIAPLVLSRQE